MFGVLLVVSFQLLATTTATPYPILPIQVRQRQVVPRCLPRPGAHCRRHLASSCADLRPGGARCVVQTLGRLIVSCAFALALVAASAFLAFLSALRASSGTACCSLVASCSYGEPPHADAELLDPGWRGLLPLDSALEQLGSGYLAALSGFAASAAASASTSAAAACLQRSAFTSRLDVLCSQLFCTSSSWITLHVGALLAHFHVDRFLTLRTDSFAGC